MVGALIHEQAKPVCTQPRTAKDRTKLADIVDHTSVPIRPARFRRTGGQEYTVRPVLDFATLANHLPIGCPKRGTLQEQTPDQAAQQILLKIEALGYVR